MHTQWESLANTHILGIAPYEPGKPIEETEREYGVHDAIKLASNENPLAPSERVQRAIAAQLAHLNRYPDGSGFYLRQALAKKHGFTHDQIVLGNGSNELIELAVRTFLKPGDEAIVPHPSFVVYPMIVQAAGGIRVMVMLREHRLDLEAMARAITPRTKMVFVANPNNPTATIVTADEVEAFMARVPERTIVIFDEAYIEFAMGPDFPDALNYIRQGRKVIVLRTFSKAASLAGLRVGYGIADADAISLMNRIRQPFNVNSLAQAAGLAALEDENHVLECVRMIEAGRHFLYDEFKALGIRYVPSRANFILVDVGRSASDIYQRLLKEGVIVRPMTPFGMESALRVTVGTPQENGRLVKALKTGLGPRARRSPRHRCRLHQARHRGRRRAPGLRTPARVPRQPSHGRLGEERLAGRAGRPLPRCHRHRDADRRHGAACDQGGHRAVGGARRSRQRARSRDART